MIIVLEFEMEPYLEALYKLLWCIESMSFDTPFRKCTILLQVHVLQGENANSHARSCHVCTCLMYVCRKDRTGGEYTNQRVPGPYSTVT